MDESPIIGFDLISILQTSSGGFELISYTQLDSFIACKWCNASFYIVMAIQRVGPNFAFHFGGLYRVVSICSRHSFMIYTDMRLLRSTYINNCICYCFFLQLPYSLLCIQRGPSVHTSHYMPSSHLQDHVTCHLNRGPTHPIHFVKTMTVLIKYEKY